MEKKKERKNEINKTKKQKLETSLLVSVCMSQSKSMPKLITTTQRDRTADQLNANERKKTIKITPIWSMVWKTRRKIRTGPMLP